MRDELSFEFFYLFYIKIMLLFSLNSLLIDSDFEDPSGFLLRFLKGVKQYQHEFLSLINYRRKREVI